LARDDTGVGRWVVDLNLGPRADRNIPDTVHAIEAASYADDVYVVDRNGYVLYENHRGDDGLMLQPFRARDVIFAERNRPPTPVHDFSPLDAREHERAAHARAAEAASGEGAGFRAVAPPVMSFASGRRR
jgi:hypothetical protein